MRTRSECVTISEGRQRQRTAATLTRFNTHRVESVESSACLFCEYRGSSTQFVGRAILTNVNSGNPLAETAGRDNVSRDGRALLQVDISECEGEGKDEAKAEGNIPR
ncbi:unnamed protein product [Soboliphyme baturini]|uniref:Uncharacterized protein n=1 Tax=Soboliphyme baturini TaxID=241478 RepID=A0A183IIL3_9BILA|nr:unnamed protein product [Soboliphyme baturini]